ncbi:MAG: hypothetical protein MJ198_07590 [Bacteroidales bacterium]|nr:hypothetical protein [Bacteroidales bacterium]
MKIKTFLLLSLHLFFSFSVFGQYFSWGSEPTRTAWKQINTANFQVIYPKDFDSVAQEFTKKLEYVYYSCSKGLQHEPKKISVILHNQTNISNGSLAWCPSQMDIYTIPSQNLNAQEWYENLAIHEFRHFVQMDKMNQGITKILYFILGEQAVGAIAGIYIPKWFMEGDAVFAETSLSSSGRGRQADFSMGLRAQLYEKGIYSYSKGYFGSYKDFVPNYYELGYFLLANSNKLYGDGLQANVIDYTARHPFSLRPVNKAIKEKTGLSRRKLYEDIFQQQANEWKLKHDREIQTKYDTIARAKKIYTNYSNGIQLNDSVFLAERYGLDRIPQLIKIENGKEKILSNIAFKQNEEKVSSNGKSLVWFETHYNVRWEMKQSSVVYIYDIEKDKTKKIKTKKHIFSPAISPSNERIVSSETDESGKYYLTFFDINTKEILKQVAAPNHDAILQPSWNENGSKIIFIGLNTKGKRILEYDVLEDSFNEILPYTNEDLTSPLYWHEYVLYSSSYSGVDNMYAIHRETKNISRITVSDFGCKFPSVSDSSLVFSNYTSDGYQLCRIKLNPKDWHDLKIVKKDNYNLAQMLTNKAGGSLNFENMPDTTYLSKKYSKILHAINIHSWMPLCLIYNGDNLQEIGNGLQIVSQNKLGTTFVNAGYKWNKFEASRGAFAKITYKGLYPIFELECSKGSQDFTRTVLDKGKFKDVDIQYDIFNIYGRIYVPFNLSSKSYYRQITLGTTFQHLDYQLVECPNEFRKNFYNQISSELLAYTVSFYNIRKQALRELAPRYGQKIFMGYETFNLPFLHESKTNPPLFFTELWLYFPGLQRSHSLNFYGGLERYTKELDEFTISERQISLPRGLTENLLTQRNLYTFKVNYAFPVCYPDVELGDFLYVKRLRCNAFCDNAIWDEKKWLYTLGTEFIADFHFCNILVPVNSGIRISFVPNYHDLLAEFLLSFNFSEL